MKNKKILKTLLTSNIISLSAFILITFYIFIKNDFFLDSFINQNISYLYTPFLNSFFFFITNIFGIYFLFFISLIIFIILYYTNKNSLIYLLISGITGGYVLGTITKYLIQRIRPENSLININGYSFPSGHATISIIFFLFIIFIFKDDIKNKFLKYIFITINILLFLLIGFSRIYLNVHWFSDVLAGFLLGIFWFTFILIFKNYLFHK